MNTPPPPPVRRRPVRVAAALAAAGCLLATGCSASGARSDSATDSLGKAATGRLRVALVTHASEGDTFWNLVKKGAEAAAAKDNIDLTYASDPDSAAQAELVRDAVKQKVDGIAVTLAKPQAMQNPVAAAKAADIPVVGLNSGIDSWQSEGSWSSSARTRASPGGPSATSWTTSRPSTPCVSSTSGATSPWRPAAPA